MQQKLFIAGASKQWLQIAQISINRKWFRIDEIFIFIFQPVPWTVVVAGIGEYTVVRWLDYSWNSFSNLQSGMKTRSLCATHSDWTKATKQKERNNSNGTIRRVNRICVLRTWCEIRMFIVNIKTCRRHDVIGHIICIRALYECIECMRAVLPTESREVKRKNCEKIVIECVWHWHTPHTLTASHSTTRECAGEILMRFEVCRTRPPNHLFDMPWWYADYCTCIDFAGGNRTKSECEALRRS